jgi:hypothetical protein
VWFGLAATAIVAVAAVWLLDATRPRPLSLGVLAGLEPVEVRPANAKRSCGIAIYHVPGRYEDVVASIQKDTGHAGQKTFTQRVHGWYLPGGAFELDGPSIHARPNKVDPESMEVLGAASDSDRFVTVWVRDARKDPDLWRCLKRAVRGR